MQTISAGGAMALPLGDYLHRIGFQGEPGPDAATLHELHWRHVHTIPFENLDIWRGQLPSLAPEALFHKLVAARRGGYCFEMNSLFYSVLGQLGFQVRNLLARVLYQRSEPGPLTHQALWVELDGQAWLVDVGFGGPGLRAPLPLRSGAEAVQGPDRLRLINRADLGYCLQCWLAGQWTDLYAFTTSIYLPVDCQVPHYYMAHAAESRFTQDLVCVMPTEGGRKTLVNGQLRITEGGVTERWPLADRAALAVALADHFGLLVDADQMPWPEDGRT